MHWKQTEEIRLRQIAGTLHQMSMAEDCPSDEISNILIPSNKALTAIQRK